jgi:hypothetical protein
MTSVEDDLGEWSRAESLSDLGELTARWLEGTIVHSPWQGDAPPDVETTPLIPFLAAMNRMGYVTEFSQPAEVKADSAQRAVVSGYCLEGNAERLASLSLETELIVITHYPGMPATYEIPITRIGNATSTIVPGYLLPDANLWPWDHYHPLLVAEAAASYFVTICDPRWGRNDLLWDASLEALGRDLSECKGALIDPDALWGAAGGNGNDAKG